MSPPYFQVLGHSADASVAPVVIYQGNDPGKAKSTFTANLGNAAYAEIERTEVAKSFRQAVSKPEKKTEPVTPAPVA
jgi:hypothetical protein